MKTKSLFALAFFLTTVFFVFGCTQEVRYSPSEISGYPAATQKLIREGTIAMGMTPDQVRYSWGAPSEVNVLPPDKEGKTRQEWIYKDTISLSTATLVFVNNELMEISTKGLTSRKFVSPSAIGK